MISTDNIVELIVISLCCDENSYRNKGNVQKCIGRNVSSIDLISATTPEMKM